MTISDIIQIVGIIVSLAIGVASIIISCKTLKQNSKMIEESTRPCIAVYGKKVYFGVAKYVLIIKNFGATGGTITDFKCNTDLKKYTILQNFEPFNHIVGTTLAPNQSIFCELDLKKLKDKKLDPFVFEVSYKGVKNYQNNTFVVNVTAEIENTTTHTHTDSKNNTAEKIIKEISIMNDAINGIGEQLID